MNLKQFWVSQLLKKIRNFFYVILCRLFSNHIYIQCYLQYFSEYCSVISIYTEYCKVKIRKIEGMVQYHFAKRIQQTNKG
jgi:hypothetical protein